MRVEYVSLKITINARVNAQSGLFVAESGRAISRRIIGILGKCADCAPTSECCHRGINVSPSTKESECWRSECIVINSSRVPYRPSILREGDHSQVDDNNEDANSCVRDRSPVGSLKGQRQPCDTGREELVRLTSRI